MRSKFSASGRLFPQWARPISKSCEKHSNTSFEKRPPSWLYAEKLPYVLTIFLAAVGWGITRTIDRLADQPLIEYEVHSEGIKSNDNQVFRKFIIDIRNLSPYKAHENAIFQVLPRIDSNASVLREAAVGQKTHLSAVPPAYVGMVNRDCGDVVTSKKNIPSNKKTSIELSESACTIVTAEAAEFRLDSLPPRGGIRLFVFAKNAGEGDIIVVGTARSGAMLMSTPTLESFIVRHELGLIGGLLFVGVLLMILRIAFGRLRIFSGRSSKVAIGGFAFAFLLSLQPDASLADDVLVESAVVKRRFDPNGPGVKSVIKIKPRDDQYNESVKELESTNDVGIAKIHKVCPDGYVIFADPTIRYRNLLESEKSEECAKNVPLFVVKTKSYAELTDVRNWAMQAGDMNNQRYSKLNQINAGNVGRMQVAWTFSTGVLRGHEGSPLVIGDTMYIHSPFPNKVFAMDLNTQTIKWKYEPKQDPSVIPQMCCDTVSRGVAYAQGKVFLQQADSTLVALDSKVGKVLWSVKNGDPSIGAVNTNAPHVFKDKVITGISGGEWGVRGFLAAYSIDDGSLVWKGYSTGPDNEMLIDPNTTTTWKDGTVQAVGSGSSLSTWQQDQWKIGGGTTWGWYSYDSDLNLLYYGTGNPSNWNPAQRPGDNRWTGAIWARDVDTGKVKWVYQMTPYDEWDFDGTNEMILADITVKGEMTKALVHFDRNGFGYTLDRTNGALLVAEKFDPSVNWASHVDMKTGRPQVVAKYSTAKNGPNVSTRGVCPAAIGSKDQQPAAFNPNNGMFYVPTSHVCMDYEPFQIEFVAGQPYVGSTLSMYPVPNSTKNMGNLIVWDANQGKVVQSKAEKFSVWSGVLTTAGGIACYGTLEGYLKCVDAKDINKELFKFKTPSGIIGNVFSYLHKGTQYIGVYSGIGGWAGIGMAAGLEKDADGLGAVGGFRELSQYTELGGSLTVFALPH